MNEAEIKQAAYTTGRRKGCIAHNMKDWTGKEIYNWHVISYSHTDRNRKRHYLRRCKCGTEITGSLTYVLLGKSKSCGCLNVINHTKHGMSNTMVHNIWGGMIQRCTNQKATAWKYYGGRGITICDRWAYSFENFFSDMGNPPSKKHSIDRINNDGNYEPGNCRWATASQQAKNRRRKIPSPPNTQP